MGLGRNNWTGTIDGAKVKILTEGYDAGGQYSFGLGSPDGKGEYPNQIAFIRVGGGNAGRGSFWRWDATADSWVPTYGNEAVEYYRKNTEVQSKDKEGFNVPFKTAPNPIGSSSLRYPENVSLSDNSDYVLFDFFDYQPPFKDNQIFNAQLPDALKDARANGWTRKNADKRYFTNELLSQYLRTGQSANLYKRDGSYPQILLYMPDDISDTLKAEWQGKSFGSTTAGILSASGAAGITNKLKGAANVGNKNIQRAPIETAASLVTALAKGITGDTITASDIFAGVSGAIRNPNVEVLFQKMNLRTFDLSFKLVPYNPNEAKTIQSIINVFKKSMLPTYRLGQSKVLGTKGDDNRGVEASFIKVPKVCKVTYMHGDKPHPVLPTYKMCALTDMGINYTPDGNYATYNDASPVAYEIKLSFMETKLLFSEEINIPKTQAYPNAPLALDN